MIARVLVNSPLQVIGAWEFQQYLSEEREGTEFDLILVQAGSARSVKQTQCTAARLGLGFRTLGDRGHGPARVRKRFTLVRREVGDLGADDLLAVGAPWFDLYGDAMARSRAGEVWALDDGVGNWRYLQALVSRAEFPETYRLGAVRKLAKRVLVGRILSPPWEELHWFSLFARYLVNHERVHQNSLSRLRGRSQLTGGEDSVLFLGSPLVSAKILSGADYSALCRKAADRLAERYPGTRLIYVRHRAESVGDHGTEFFDHVEDSVGPIELRWLDGLRVPRAVAGVYSTALFTLGELLRDRSDIVSLFPAGGFRWMARGHHVAKLTPLFEACQSDGTIILERLQR